MTAVGFEAGHLRCDEQTREAEVRRGTHLRIRSDRLLPAGHHHPVLDGLTLDGDVLRLSVGLRTAPRFRRGECRRTWWAANVEFDRPDDVPGSVAVRHLDPGGEVSSTRRIAVSRRSE